MYSLFKPTCTYTLHVYVKGNTYYKFKASKTVMWHWVKPSSIVCTQQKHVPNLLFCPIWPQRPPSQPNNGDIKERISILRRDKLLRTAAQMWDDSESTADRKTTKQCERLMADTSKQTLPAAGLKWLPLLKQSDEESVVLCIKIHTKKPILTNAVCLESWIVNHPTQSASRAAARVSSSWQLPLGPRNILTTVAHAGAENNYSLLPCDTPDKLNSSLSFKGKCILWPSLRGRPVRDRA